VQYRNLDAHTHRGISIDDVIVDPKTFKWTQPTIPGFQPKSTRRIFTLPPPSSVVNNSQIQDIINQAAAYTGQRPIVYLPAGKYMINESIVFKPNSDIQLMGTERASWYGPSMALIEWHGGSNTPMLLILGPSKVTVKFLTMFGNNLADGYWITNTDQVGSRVYVEDFNPYAPTTHNILADHLDNLKMDFYNLYDHGIFNSTGILAIGGPCAAQGSGDFRIAGFGGATSADAGTGSLYDVKNGGRLSITDTWYEGPGLGWLNISNSQGSFSFSGGNVSPYHDGQNTITVQGFRGQLLLNSVSLVYNASISNSSSYTNVLFAGVYFLASWLHQDKTGGANTIISTLNPDGNPNHYKIYLNDTLSANRTADAARILDAFAVLRAARRAPAGPADGRPDGVSDVRFFRNWEIFTRTALRVVGDPSATKCLGNAPKKVSVGQL